MMRVFKLILLSLVLATITFILNIPAFAQTSSCGSGTARSTGLVTTPSLFGKFNTSGACVVDTKATYAPFKLPTYDDLKSIYYTQSKATKSTITSLTAVTDQTVYLVSGNLTIASTPSGSGTAVVFVEGQLIINSNYTYGTPNSGTVFVVKGDVNILQSVARVDAVIISAGTTCTAYDGAFCPTINVLTPQLVINGSLISLNEATPIKFRRSLTDNTQPAEKINHQVKYLVILRNLFSENLQKWSEITGEIALPTPGPSVIATPTPTSTPTPTPPNLATMGLAYPAGSTIAAGTSVQFTATVANSGSGPAGSSSGRFCLNNASCTGANTTGRVGTDKTIPSLAPSASTTVNADPWVATAGTYTPTFCADAGNAIAESNEGDNCITGGIGFTVAASAKRVFVTSTIYTGNLGGLAGADSQCQTRANAASLGGTWRAWLSDSSQSPSNRFIQSSGPYRLLNGTTIANSWSDLTDGILAAPINISELGTTPPNTVDICGIGLGGSNVYTGTTAQGTLFNPGNPFICNNWSTSSSSVWADFGATVRTNTEWSNICYAGSANCSQFARLYCFEQ